MSSFEVIFVYSGTQATSRLDTRLVKMFVIKDVTYADRKALRQVLNSDDFRNKFGVTGSTSQESRLVLYYGDIVVPFEEMFDKLFCAVRKAVADNEPARVR